MLREHLDAGENYTALSLVTLKSNGLRGDVSILHRSYVFRDITVMP